MSRHYIDDCFWIDEKVQQWNTDTRYLALYLMTNQHVNTEGLYQLKKMYMMADLGWDEERFNKAFDKLLDEGFIKYDESVSIVFVRNALKYNGPENPNQAIGAIKQLKRLPETNLIEDFLNRAREHGKKIIEVLEDSSSEFDYNCLPNPSGNGSSKPSETSDSNSNSNSNSYNNGGKTESKFSAPQKENGRYDYPKDFEELYALYPDSKGTKKAGWRKWANRRRNNVPQEKLVKAVENYAAECKNDNKEKKYIKHLSTFLGPDEHWREYLNRDISENTGSNRSHSSVTEADREAWGE